MVNEGSPWYIVCLEIKMNAINSILNDYLRIQ